MENTNTLKTILLIDDDNELAEIVRAYFRQKDIEIIHFTEPLLALKLMQDQHSKIDVILTDLNMPQMNGMELIKRMRESHITVPILLITASTDVDTAVQAVEAGADDFVVKPLHFPQLYISAHRAFSLRKLDQENKVLKESVEITKGFRPEGIVGKSESFRAAMDLAKRVANSHATVFIHGESGVGKEVFARAIHDWSPRADRPFVAINCSAIPENLLESELFGHSKGAFTGAVDKKLGLFEAANGGTLFLDEIGDMNLGLQAKLLRVLQERKIKRIGENQDRDVDVRVLTATHRNLRQEVQEKRFREDLYFRLNVIPIRIPPLRERADDVLPLAEFFLRRYNLMNQRRLMGFSREAKEFLLRQPWVGNVRELENTIERAAVLSQGSEISLQDFLIFEDVNEQSQQDDLPPSDGQTFFFRHGPNLERLDVLEKEYIKYVFDRNHGAREQTARILGIDRKTLYRKLQEMNQSSLQA